MTIEGLGKKFEEARLARSMTLDEAARMTKIRPSRLAEIEADDFSQFPSLAYAKGFLLIYGKFLDVDVTPYMEAFEGSDAVTVDGYSYLQDNPAPKPVRPQVVPRRTPKVSSSGGKPTSLMPLVIAVVVIIVGYSAMRLILNIQRIAPRTAESTAAVQASATPTAPPPSIIAPSPAVAAVKTSKTEKSPPAIAPTTTPPVGATTVPRQAATPPTTPPPATPPPATVAPTTAPVAAATPPPASTPAPAPEPEVRRAEPVRPEDLAKVAPTEATGPNKVSIRPLKKTYIKVVVDNEASTPAFERWISPTDRPIEFSGQRFSVRVLDRDAVQIKKNGKTVAEGDTDVAIE